MTEAPDSFDRYVSDGPRPWVVTLRVRSAVVLENNAALNMLSSLGTTIPVAGVKIRNHLMNVPDGQYIHGLIAEAAGVATGSEQAVSLLANLASPYIQVVALAGNAVAGPEMELLAYAPPHDGKPGRFHTQRPINAEPPASRIRFLPAQALMNLIKALGDHPDEERLHRTMAHFQLALQNVEAQGWTLAAEHLFIATENLQGMVFKRLCREAGLPESGKSKHTLAVEAGLTVRDGSNQHLNDFDSMIRRDLIFHGDQACYADLKASSDHFEHGSRDFGVVREKAAASARTAFAHVRRAVLDELGIAVDSGLREERFDSPLPAWNPQLEVHGSYEHPTADNEVRLDPEQFTDAWPQFHGLNITPRISLLLDDLESKERHLQFKADGNGASFVDGQTASIEGTLWVMPGIHSDEAEEPDSSTVSVVVRHEDGTETHHGALDTASDDPAERR